MTCKNCNGDGWMPGHWMPELCPACCAYHDGECVPATPVFNEPQTRLQRWLPPILGWSITGGVVALIVGLAYLIGKSQ